jgi:hypothetical protein
MDERLSGVRFSHFVNNYLIHSLILEVGSTAVKHLQRHPNVTGSIQATNAGSGREKLF